jgi:hypothetical protein
LIWQHFEHCLLCMLLGASMLCVVLRVVRHLRSSQYKSEWSLPVRVHL